MSRIDNVIIAMTETKRAVWAANAARVIAHAPSQNPANALRLRDAIAVLDATHPAEDALIAASRVDWDRHVACVTRVRPGKFIVQVPGVALPRPHTTLSAARAAFAFRP